MVSALRETADRAAVGAELARAAFRYAALELADEVLRTGRVPEPLVAAYAEARAKWTDEAARAYRAAQALWHGPESPARPSSSPPTGSARMGAVGRVGQEGLGGQKICQPLVKSL